MPLYATKRIDLDQALEILEPPSEPPRRETRLLSWHRSLRFSKQLSLTRTPISTVWCWIVCPAMAEPLQPVPRAVSDVPIDDYADYVNLMDNGSVS